jgi:hypothetical protein
MEESRVLIWHRDKLKLTIITDQFLQAVFDHILGRDVVKKLMQVIYLWLTSCSFVLGAESIPTAVPSREHSSSKSFSVLDDTLVQMVEALRYKP